MGIKVIYQNNATGEVLKEILFSDVEIKAIESDVNEFPEWHTSALRHKADIGMTSILVSARQGNRNTRTLEKYSKVAQLKIETVKERNIRLENEKNGSIQPSEVS